MLSVRANTAARHLMSRALACRRWGTGSHVSDNDPAVIDAELKRSLGGHVPSRVPTAPHWSEVLASDSEAVVKAERHAAATGHAADPGLAPAAVAADVKELQAHTVAVIREEAWVATQVEEGGADEALPARRGGGGAWRPWSPK